jgi:gliding motility-associated-like protein
MMRIILLLFIFLPFYCFSQCQTIICNPNAGIFSNNNPATIAYDNIGSAFHSTYVLETNGDWKVWGENMNNNGQSHALNPTIINSANYPALTGNILKVAVASDFTPFVQLIVLTSTGLFALGNEGIVIDNEITTSRVFQKLTINNKTDGLPIGVTPSNVKMLFASFRTLILTTCEGNVYVLSLDPNVRGNGSTGSSLIWSQVMENPTTPLSNVIVTRGQRNVAFALKADGTIWSWGSNVYLGNNTNSQTLNYATQMTLPAGIPGVKMIQMTNLSYYILGTDQKIYALGGNSNGQLADNTSTTRLSWVNAKNPDNSIINDVLWISANEHDPRFSSFSLIKSGGKFFTAGNDSGRMIGRTGSTLNLPDFPNGVLSSDVITFAEVGGHTTMIVKEGVSNYGYVGHRINGSLGDGTSTSQNISSFNFTLPPVVSICGSICIAPTVTAVSPICPGENAVFTIQGFNGDIVSYNINNGPNQTVTIGTTETATVTINNTQINQTINLTNISNLFSSCSLVLNTSLTIQLNNTLAITPLFTQVNPICTGSTLSSLPNTSNNGIIGTWSPALNNTATTTYTFTPNTGQCAVTTSMTIVVNSNVPNFTQVAPICSGGVLNALPINSNNGISGTWSPALNNSATTTYTFTPNVGQCATTQTMTIVVNTVEIPTINSTPASCSSNEISTISNYVAGITYTFSPSGPVVAVGGVISGMISGTNYSVTAGNGNCTSLASAIFNNDAQLITPAIPTITSTPASCTSAEISTISNFATGITYTFSPSGPVVAVGGVISGMTSGTNYTVTAGNGNCTSLASAIFINDAQLITPAIPTITSTPASCTSAEISTISDYVAGITYTFSPSGPVVAVGGVISGMILGTNYTVTAGNGNCTSLASAIFNNDAQFTPTVPNFTQVTPICAGTNLSLPTTSINGVTGTWSPIFNNSNTTTYTFNPAAGLCATTATMTIVVKPIPSAPTVTTPINYCINQSSVPLSAIGSNLLWYTAATGGTGATSLTPSTATAGTFNYYVSQTVNGCESSRALIRVNVNPYPEVILNSNSFTFCSGEMTNVQVSSDVPGALFSWNLVSGNINGATTGSNLSSFTNSVLSLQTGVLVPTTIIYNIVAEVNGCKGSTKTITITINPRPTFTYTVNENPICSNTAVEIEFESPFPNTTYSWTVDITQTNGVTGFTQGTGNSITDILETTGLSTGTVTYIVTSKIGNCIGEIKRITITVKPLPISLGSGNQTICSGGSPNLSLSSPNPNVAFIFTAIPSGGVIGASGGNTLSSPNGQIIINNQTLTNNGNTQGYVDYTFIPVLNGCNGLPITRRVFVNPLPKPTLSNGVICKDASGNVYQSFVLNAGLPNTNHTFEWTFTNTAGITIILPGNTNTITANAEGTYSVTATNTITTCTSAPSSTATATITSSLPATAVNAQVSNMFSGNSTITVTTTGGTGNYLYQLNEGNYQENLIFTNVNAGVHTIKVIDTQGCTYLTTTVTVIDYMKFFTPNGDGYQDVWKISGLNQENAKIYIYDRYGKLIKQISGSENANGWNGIYNGQLMPATDYWFTIEYLENKETKVFKSNFSLKR